MDCTLGRHRVGCLIPVSRSKTRKRNVKRKLEAEGGDKDVGLTKVGTDGGDGGGKLHRLTGDGILYHSPISGLNGWSCAERHFGGANSLYRRSARQFQEGKVLCTRSTSSHCDTLVAFWWVEPMGTELRREGASKEKEENEEASKEREDARREESESGEEEEER